MALTAVERSERAKEAAAARWGAKESRMQKWHDLEYSEALTQYAELRNEMTEIGRILAQRQPVSENSDGGYTCYQCHQPMKKIVYTEPQKNEAGIFENIFICSPNCHLLMMTARKGGVPK